MPPLAAAKKVRLPMIDIAKGIGIILIVFGHDMWFQMSFWGPSEILRSFRIPFFFFISGATFAIGRRHLSTIARERADAWLKPFALVVLLIGAVKIAMGTGTAENVMLGLTYSTGYTLTPMSVWFLPHLWLLYMACAAFLTYGARLVDSWPKRIVTLLVMVTAGYLFLELFDSAKQNAACAQFNEFDWQLFSCGLPMSADFLPLSAAYFLLGHFLSSRVKEFKANVVLFLLSGAALLASYFAFHVSIDFNARRYDNLVICTCQALLGIYMMLNVSSLLSKIPPVTKLLTYVGRGSLFILLFHLHVLALWPKFAAPLLNSPSLVAISGIAMAVALPLGLWELAKRNTLTSALFLPLKKAPAPTPAKA